ncbi:MAG: hypothetical protein MUF41_00265 [Sphingopyxis sp.]|jgi:hypothetical protein|nr:hypothetical protein [Sphingopyxis sp.]
MANWIWVSGLGIAAIAGISMTTDMGGHTSVEVAKPVAMQRLASTYRPVTGTGFGVLTLRTTGSNADGVTISISRNNDPNSIACAVRVESVSADRSIIEPDCETAVSERGNRARVAARMMNIVVREHVLASVEQREFDTVKVSRAVRQLLPGAAAL